MMDINIIVDYGKFKVYGKLKIDFYDYMTNRLHSYSKF